MRFLNSKGLNRKKKGIKERKRRGLKREKRTSKRKVAGDRREKIEKEGDQRDEKGGGSVFKSPPGSGSVFDIRIRIQQVKFGHKNSVYVKIFHDFHLILK